MKTNIDTIKYKDGDSFEDIIIPVNNGGTGADSSLTKLEIDEIWDSVMKSDEEVESNKGILPIIHGGTSADNEGEARKNLGLGGINEDGNGPLSEKNGGTGSTSALTNEEIDEIWKMNANNDENDTIISTTTLLPPNRGGTGVSSISELKALLGIEKETLKNLLGLNFIEDTGWNDLLEIPSDYIHAEYRKVNGIVFIRAAYNNEDASGSGDIPNGYQYEHPDARYGQSLFIGRLPKNCRPNTGWFGHSDSWNIGGIQGNFGGFNWAGSTTQVALNPQTGDINIFQTYNETSEKSPDKVIKRWFFNACFPVMN